MNCSQIEKLISAYIDLELSASESLSVRKHLLNCKSCHEKLEVEKSMKLCLGSLAVIEPNFELQSQVMSKVMDSGWTKRSINHAVAMVAMTACASALIVAVVISFVDKSGQPVAQEVHASPGQNSSGELADSSNYGQVYPVKY